MTYPSTITWYVDAVVSCELNAAIRHCQLNLRFCGGVRLGRFGINLPFPHIVISWLPVSQQQHQQLKYALCWPHFREVCHTEFPQAFAIGGKTLLVGIFIRELMQCKVDLRDLEITWSLETGRTWNKLRWYQDLRHRPCSFVNHSRLPMSLWIENELLMTKGISRPPRHSTR